MDLSRRAFLRSAAGAAAGFIGLRYLVGCRGGKTPGLYGELIPDPTGTINMPRGFTCRVFSRTGETMDDGFFVPGRHDGMAAFPGPEGKTILVRNHELLPGQRDDGPFGPDNRLTSKLDPKFLWDAGSGKAPGLGGTTTLVFDIKSQKLERHFLSLAGTWRNCAGGPTPWKSWITCEESVQRAESPIEKDHGYCFEVPASAEPGLVVPVPLRAMGRFNHEAAAVDAPSGVVYETEDRGDGLFYRFLPDVPGTLARGGRLQALRMKGRPGIFTSNRNPATQISVGETLEVDWIDLEDVESPDDDLRERGAAAGAAVFSRGEGIWTGKNAAYFACTNGGAARLGQVWRYVPSPNEGKSAEKDAPGKLELFVEPNDSRLLEACDNLTVAPWGDLLLCEDGPGKQHIVGVTPEGRLYTLLENILNGSEFAGATFSPDGGTLFVNIQKPGLTMAVSGPWITDGRARA